jgi:septal ring factor EnvC (AmiA/AmiB activator)
MEKTMKIVLVVVVIMTMGETKDDMESIVIEMHERLALMEVKLMKNQDEYEDNREEQKKIQIELEKTQLQLVNLKTKNIKLQERMMMAEDDHSAVKGDLIATKEELTITKDDLTTVKDALICQEDLKLRRILHSSTHVEVTGVVYISPTKPSHPPLLLH